jgi:hypothetical protein
MPVSFIPVIVPTAAVRRVELSLFGLENVAGCGHAAVSSHII